MNYYLCKGSSVVATAHALKEAEFDAGMLGLTLVEQDSPEISDVLPSALYFDGSSVKKKPDRPGEFFDWTGSSWVANPYRAREEGEALIDAAAGRARARWITVTDGQDATYIAKLAEALAYIAADYPEDLTAYPYVAGESQPKTWMTPTQAATRIATLGTYWRDVVGPQIEALRVNGKGALADLGTAEEINTHIETVVSALDALRPGA